MGKKLPDSSQFFKADGVLIEKKIGINRSVLVFSNPLFLHHRNYLNVCAIFSIFIFLFQKSTHPLLFQKSIYEY